MFSLHTKLKKEGTEMKFYWITANIRKLKRKIFDNLESIIGEKGIKEAFHGFTIRERTYHTWVLFQMFLNQAASGSSCGEAIAWAIGQGLVPVTTSPKTSAYCNAKGRLSEEPIFELMKKVGKRIEGQAHKRERFFGRDVKVVDGTSVQLPDTGSNQTRYPQSPEQKPGCGQPVMILCAVIGLASGAVLDCAVGSMKVGERNLFKNLLRSFRKGDLLLGDRAFGSYAEVASMLKKKVDFVFRQKKKALKTKSLRRIGKEDWIATWKRPLKPGTWVASRELPEFIKVRAIRFRTEIKGFRSREIILFTSLMDPKKYPKDKLMELYYRRWEMELRIRDIKTTMGLELLKSKTSTGCRKELWMGLLAYNLVRGIMLDASLRGRLPIARISFKGTLKWMDAFASGPVASYDPEWVYTLFLDHLIKAKVPARPGRVEPRKRKRRPKYNYPVLTIPRKQAITEALHA